MKTVRQHVEEMTNLEYREKCLINLDPLHENDLCYTPGYALMLGVNQSGHEKGYWQDVYESFGNPNRYNHYYVKQEVQQDEKQSKK